jgi:hypothetical protein
MRAVPIIGSFPIRFQTNLDLASLGFAVALGIACGLIFGAAPAAQLSRVNPQAALQSGSRNGGRSALRNALMGVEVALALAVLLAAALFWRSFNDARDADPGFTREGVLLANYDYTGRNIGPAASRDFAARLLDRLHSVTGVDAAAIASAIPLDIHGLPLRSFAIEGRPSTRPSGSLRTGAASDQALSNTVTPGYLRTMGIPLLAGSDFADLRDAALPAQVIVNEEFVRRFVGSGEAIGRRVENRGTSYVIAGVARNSTNESFGEAPTPVVYFSYRDRPFRSRRDPSPHAGRLGIAARAELERIVRELDPSLPLYDVRTLNEHVEKNLFLRRIPARMFVVLGPLLLVLAAIGIYAVVAYAVSQRTTEIGVRLALGATSLRVVSQIVGESLRIVAAGAFVAWFVALFIAIHLVRGPIDAVTFVGVPARAPAGRRIRVVAAGAARHQRRCHDGVETRLTAHLVNSGIGESNFSNLQVTHSHIHQLHPRAALLLCGACGTPTPTGGRIMKRVLRDAVYAALISISAGAVPAFAQLDTGAIVGTVRDQSAAVVPGATVTATQESTGSASTAVTTEKGQFVFPNLKIGTYSIAAELSGFRKSVQTGIVLHVQERLEVDVRIELGNVTEEVVVRGVSPLLQTQTADVGYAVDQRQVTDLPLLGRRYSELALLTTGVVTAPGGLTGRGEDGLFNVNGNLATWNNFILDGGDNNSASTNLQERSTEVVQPPVDALEEFRVQTRTYSAEFGKAAGAVINASIKQGTNAFRGNLFEFFRDEAFNANTWENNRAGRPKGEFNQHIAGGTLGGPLLRNRTFFFGDYQATRTSRGVDTAGDGADRSDARGQLHRARGRDGGGQRVSSPPAASTR